MLSQLALRGYDANLTLGNTKAVDILVSDPSSGNMFRLEVKTTSKNAGKSRIWGQAFSWVMNEKHEAMVDPTLFYCFVALQGTQSRFFVVPSDIVATYVHEQHRVWLADDPSRKDTSMRSFRVLLEASGNEEPSPPAARYEDAWHQLSY